MIDAMKGKQTLKGAELQDGDIICFQQPEKSQDARSDSITLVELDSTSSMYEQLLTSTGPRQWTRARSFPLIM